MIEDTKSAESASDRMSELNDLLAKSCVLGSSEFQKNSEMILQSARSFAKAITPAFQQCAKALTKFGEFYISCAKTAYLQHHKRLPGGTSTARMRKKRRSKVLNWFSEELERSRQ